MSNVIEKRTIRLTNHEPIINNEERLFTDADFPVGTVSHQGDIILVRVAELPNNKKARKDRQVATGNTQGSRHILEGGSIFDCNVNSLQQLIFDSTNITIDKKYIGPAFIGGLLTHPEHGNQGFSDEMSIVVVYQRNLDTEEKEARVLD